MERIINMNGFLDTEGKLHECEPWEHLDLAWEIVIEQMKHSVKNRLDAEEYLQKLGWVVIRTNDVYGLTGRYITTDSEERLHLTDAQKEWLNKAYADVNESCRESIDDLFEWNK